MLSTTSSRVLHLETANASRLTLPLSRQHQCQRSCNPISNRLLGSSAPASQQSSAKMNKVASSSMSPAHPVQQSGHFNARNYLPLQAVSKKSSAAQHTSSNHQSKTSSSARCLHPERTTKPSAKQPDNVNTAINCIRSTLNQS